MRHPKEGQLRAYYDGALQQEEFEWVKAHLVSCPHCAEKGAVIQARGVRLNLLMDGLVPRMTREPVSTQAAQSRFRSYLDERKESNMFRKLFSSRYRLAWVGAALALVLTLAVTFPPLRALASNFLALFRVQKIEVVEFDPDDLPDNDAMEAAASRFESVLQDQLVVESDGEPVDMDVATAKASSEFPVRFPAALNEEPEVVSQPGFYATMRVDLPSVRALFAELGYEDLTLPDSLDGAEIDIDFPAAVMALYGSCDLPEEDVGEAVAVVEDTAESCMTFLQMPAPSVSAPPELDVKQLGQAYLQLLGMKAEDAARFSQRVDWTTTMVIPVPTSRNLMYQDVVVDGVTGTFVQSPVRSYQPREYTLMWIKDGIVYALSGTGDGMEALQIAASLE